ncbi:Ni/Co efflux regulator RcnB [Bradyrhizobium japonicum]
MRTSILAMIVVAGSVIAFPVMAQTQQAAPSDQTKEQMHQDADKGLKTNEPNEQMQRDADKGGQDAQFRSVRICSRSRGTGRLFASPGTTRS